MTIFTFASFLKISWITFDFSFFLNVCHSFNLCGLLGGYRFTCESILTLFLSLLFTKSKTTQGGRGMFTCLLSKGVDSSRKGVFFFFNYFNTEKEILRFYKLYIIFSQLLLCVIGGLHHIRSDGIFNRRLFLPFAPFTSCVRDTMAVNKCSEVGWRESVDIFVCFWPLLFVVCIETWGTMTFWEL